MSEGAPVGQYAERKARAEREGKTQIVLWLPSDLVDELKALAEAEHRSMPRQVEHVVREYLNARDGVGP